MIPFLLITGAAALLLVALFVQVDCPDCVQIEEHFGTWRRIGPNEEFLDLCKRCRARGSMPLLKRIFTRSER